MLAKDVRAGKKSCLSKAHDDEPVFILRAHDVMAPLAVEAWADIIEASDMPILSPETRAKVQQARALAHQMRAWQAINGSKFPD